MKLMLHGTEQAENVSPCRVSDQHPPLFIVHLPGPTAVNVEEKANKRHGWSLHKKLRVPRRNSGVTYKNGIATKYQVATCVKQLGFRNW